MSHNRVLAAAVVAAAAIGVPGSALAIGSGGPGSKSTTVPAATASASKAPGSSDLSAVASSAGVTESQLEAGLAAAKQAGGNSPSGVAAFARATGVSPATAQRVVFSVFGAHSDRNLTGNDQPGPGYPASASSPGSAVAALATQLGVSSATARSALEQIAALSRTQGVDPASAAFAAIAHHLGVSPTRLAAALPLVKQAERAAAG
jgi:hypothetical protein